MPIKFFFGNRSRINQDVFSPLANQRYYRTHQVCQVDKLNPFYAPDSARMETIKRDIRRVYFYATGVKAEDEHDKQWLDEAADSATVENYLQGEMCGNLYTKHLLDHYLLPDIKDNPDEGRRKEALINSGRQIDTAALSYFDDDGILCGASISFLNDTPPVFCATVIRNTSADPEKREILLIASGELFSNRGRVPWDSREQSLDDDALWRQMFLADLRSTKVAELFAKVIKADASIDVDEFKELCRMTSQKGVSTSKEPISNSSFSSGSAPSPSSSPGLSPSASSSSSVMPELSPCASTDSSHGSEPVPESPPTGPYSSSSSSSDPFDGDRYQAMLDDINANANEALFEQAKLDLKEFFKAEPDVNSLYAILENIHKSSGYILAKNKLLTDFSVTSIEEIPKTQSHFHEILFIMGSIGPEVRLPFLIDSLKEIFTPENVNKMLLLKNWAYENKSSHDGWLLLCNELYDVACLINEERAVLSGRSVSENSPSFSSSSSGYQPPVSTTPVPDIMSVASSSISPRSFWQSNQGTIVGGLLGGLLGGVGVAAMLVGGLMSLGGVGIPLVILGGLATAAGATVITYGMARDARAKEEHVLAVRAAQQASVASPGVDAGLTPRFRPYRTHFPVSSESAAISSVDDPDESHSNALSR